MGRATGFERAMSRGAAVVALIASAIANAPHCAWAEPYWTLPNYWGVPDALTAADSARGVVLATCLRTGSYTDPAVLRTDRLLGGAIPRKFTAFPPWPLSGDYFRSG